MQMNRTLFDCRFKRQVETKSGQLFDVTAALPKYVNLPDKGIKCEIWNESSTANKYFDTHMRFKHISEMSNHGNQGKNKNVCECIQTQSKATSKETVDDDDINNTQSQAAAIDRRRGCSERKSYTVDFKLKTLKLLDSLSELKTKKKWEKVAEKQGINKSLVVKWNKNREKLQLEIKLNRRKKKRRQLERFKKKEKISM